MKTNVKNIIDMVLGAFEEALFSPVCLDTSGNLPCLFCSFCSVTATKSGRAVYLTLLSRLIFSLSSLKYFVSGFLVVVVIVVGFSVVVVVVFGSIRGSE